VFFSTPASGCGQGPASGAPTSPAGWHNAEASDPENLLDVGAEVWSKPTSMRPKAMSNEARLPLLGSYQEESMAHRRRERLEPGLR
jgi:hypothetical protein